MKDAVSSTDSKQDIELTELIEQQIPVLDWSCLLDWVADNIEPGDLYLESVLEKWAADHGWVKE